MSNEYHLPSDPRDYLAHIREIDSGVYGEATKNLPRGVIPVRRGRSFNQHLSSNNVIAVITTPFLIMPGDGSTNGCQFTGTNGAFTLSAAIVTNVSVALTKCYAYFSAGFGGSSLPAGWYYTEFSSDTAGVVYAETYTSGNPSTPSTRTQIAPNLSGRITATTNEVVSVNGIVFPANLCGPSGLITIAQRQGGSTTGNKSFRTKLGGTTIQMSGNSGAPFIDLLNYAVCMDDPSSLSLGRTTSTSPTGVGQSVATFATTNNVSVNTAVDNELTITLQGSSALSAPILFFERVVVEFGE